MDITSEVAITCHNKLLYTISLGVRAVFADTEHGVLTLDVWFWREPTEHEWDLFQEAASEIHEEHTEFSDVIARCNQSREPFSRITKPARWLFVRAEELDGYPNSIQVQDETLAGERGLTGPVSTPVD